MRKRNDLNSDLSPLLLFLIISTLSLTSCADNQIKTTIPSPNGNYRLEMTVNDQGAIISPTAELFLFDENRFTEREKHSIFSGKGGWPIMAEWYDDQNIIVTFCDPKRVEYSTKIVEELKAEEFSEINVHIMTYRNQKFRDKTYCS